MYKQAVGFWDGPRHIALRVRYQLVGGLLFAIGIPLILRMLFVPEVLSNANHQITVTAAIVAHLAGYVLYRRLGTYPGFAAAGAILPTFALTYGTVFVIIFFFRFDYSRFQAAGSFTLSTVWYFGWSFLVSKLKPTRLAVVPAGDISQVTSIGDVTWRVLTSPNQPPERIQGVVADLRADISAPWERFIADCALSGIPVYHVKQIVESLTGRVAIDHLSENTLGSLNPNQAYLAIKHAIDSVSAAIALVLLLPFLLVVALLIKMDSPGPSLFCQERRGYQGKVFTIYKFRTMRVAQHHQKDDRERAVTADSDQRITRLGRFLRRTRIDELPQLLNILRGEMSWVGPRPEALPLSRWYEEKLPFYRYRHIVRPGITGWAQVNQGHVSAVEDVRQKLHYDFYYVKNFSPWMDVIVYIKTVAIIINGFGAK
ncbi:sugar transferase [Rhizobium sp. AG855]|uniref:sugar transferase n=1 Tax=Rhizobium sp. AG855 TaxID=2183898 RepID=UPI000E71D362|nr:sugar transferase [Rhizobium sp. AG855]RKE79219.1 exopolysaccharide biosynthesis polyprenyl glycosylphosphotransferase [Rhizobium sp. AG855]